MAAVKTHYPIYLRRRPIRDNFPSIVRDLCRMFTRALNIIDCTPSLLYSSSIGPCDVWFFLQFDAATDFIHIFTKKMHVGGRRMRQRSTSPSMRSARCSIGPKLIYSRLRRSSCSIRCVTLFFESSTSMMTNCDWWRRSGSSPALESFNLTSKGPEHLLQIILCINESCS